MIALAIGLGFVVAFGIGFATSSVWWRNRIKNYEYLKAKLAQARMQGRLDRENSKTLDPPKPWE